MTSAALSRSFMLPSLVFVQTVEFDEGEESTAMAFSLTCVVVSTAIPLANPSACVGFWIASGEDCMVSVAGRVSLILYDVVSASSGLAGGDKDVLLQTSLCAATDSGVAIVNGRVSAKRDPLPSSDSTHKHPPILLTRVLEIAKPSPVPPYCLAVDTSS